MSTRRQLALALALLFLALAVFGAQVHRIEEAGTAERDGFVSQAETITSGHLPRDAFRPLLYPLLTAAMSFFTGDAFTAARLLSNLAAVALAGLAWGFGRRLALPSHQLRRERSEVSVAARTLDPEATQAYFQYVEERRGQETPQMRAHPTSQQKLGAKDGLTPDRLIVPWSALALVAVNPNLWILGQHTTTDMLFGALAAGSLLAALHHLERPRLASALTCGALLGLAAFTRGNAMFLLPAIALAALLARRANRCQRNRCQGNRCHPNVGGSKVEGEKRSWWKHTVLPMAAAALIGLLPHFVLRGLVFGDPFFDENWKNLAFKLYGFPDWSYLERVPFTGPLDILRSDPLGILTAAGREFFRFVIGGVGQLSGTALHAVVAGVGLLLALRYRPSRKAASWTLFAFATFLAAVCLTFFAWGRLLLVLLPILAAWMAYATMPLVRRWGRWGWLLPTALVLLLAVKTFAFRLPAFVDRHPYAELAALQELEERLEAGESLAGTMPFAGRDLEVPYVALPDGIGPLEKPEAYFRWLDQEVEEHSIAFLVISSLELRRRPPALLAPTAGATSPTPSLALVETGSDLTVWRVNKTTPPGPPAQLR